MAGIIKVCLLARWPHSEERGNYGTRTMAWLSPANFDSSSTVSKQEVDAKLDEWEMLGARVRKEARRLQRQGPTGA